MSISHLITSLFSYFRDTAAYLIGRKGGTSGFDDAADDPLQNVFIALTRETDLREVFSIAQNGLEFSLTNMTQGMVYILEPWSHQLTSCDGLAGVCHTLPWTGLAGRLREDRTRVESCEVHEEDPLWGLLETARGTLSNNRTVLCSPVLEFGSDRLLCALVAVCDTLSSENEKRLNLLERHISACLSRMQRTNSCPSGKDDLEDMNKYNENILELCADLHDNDSISLQLKLIKYLEKQTQAEFCTLFVVSEDRTELFTQVIGKRVLKEQVKFIIPLTYFNTVVMEKKVLTDQDISEDDKRTFAERLEVSLHNLLCVPVINNATSEVIAVACAINKQRASSFSPVDIKVIRHCFRYTVPVLTSTLTLQIERELKQDTQSMLQVAKNLFTHLGRFRDDAIAWSQFPLELRSLNASINLLIPHQKCTDSRSRSPSPTHPLPPQGGEELGTDFTEDEDGENDLSSAARSSSSEEDQSEVLLKVHRPSPSWSGVEETDTLLSGVIFDPNAPEVSPSPSTSISVGTKSSGSREVVSSPSVQQPHSPPSGDDDNGQQAEEEVIDGVASDQAMSECSKPTPPTESRSDTDVKTDTPFWEELSAILGEEAADDYQDQSAAVDVSDAANPPGEASTPSAHTLGFQVTTEKVGTKACMSMLQKRHSILELDWSAATLSVHCIQQPVDVTQLLGTYDVSDLLREIMQEARNLTHAERCSLFLVENDELVAKVFDGHTSGDAGEVRIPITQGIAGHVATTGEILNITDVYSHPLFYRGVDDSTGFRTRSILCFPIRDGSKVVGIAELCNKLNGLHFTKHDEDVAAAFSIYCGISIVHGLLYKKMTDAQYRSALANELMMYHMKIVEEELVPLQKQAIPKPTHFHPQVAELTYSPRGIPDGDTILAVLSMFEDMGMINRWRIDKATLARFTMLVKRGYRDTPYHNWYHAFTVGHFCFLLYKNLSQLEMLDEIEVFALFVSCICHDLDHRGTNNSFQVHSKSVLAALYSSEGSVMERHHFAQAMCILNTEGCNIFENLSRKDYQKVLDLMQDIILATDLAHHLRIITDLKKMARTGYRKDNTSHHQLLLCLLMTSCDLSDQTKNWLTTKKIAELIYREFFTQGDLEKAMGLETPEMFDREKAFIPELQINFLEHIAQPVFQILNDIFPRAGPLVEAIECNKMMWNKLRRESLERRLSSTNSLDFFHVKFSAEPAQDRLSEESETDSNQNRNG